MRAGSVSIDLRRFARRVEAERIAIAPRRAGERNGDSSQLIDFVVSGRRNAIDAETSASTSDLERGILLELAHPQATERIAQCGAQIEPARIGVFVQRDAGTDVVARTGVQTAKGARSQARGLPADAILDEHGACVGHQKIPQGAGTARNTAAVNSRPMRPRCNS